MDDVAEACILDAVAYRACNSSISVAVDADCVYIAGIGESGDHPKTCRKVAGEMAESTISVVAVRFSECVPVSGSPHASNNSDHLFLQLV